MVETRLGTMDGLKTHFRGYGIPGGLVPGNLGKGPEASGITAWRSLGVTAMAESHMDVLLAAMVELTRQA